MSDVVYELEASSENSQIAAGLSPQPKVGCPNQPTFFCFVFDSHQQSPCVFGYVCMCVYIFPFLGVCVCV